ncbi:MAG: hypothetical protein Q9214_003387 [Letrouitia sp. 1 TL-2023]
MSIKSESFPKMATRTKAASTTCANSKYKKPKPSIPATDPKYIQNLWQQVRKQQHGYTSHNQQVSYMANTAARAERKKVTPPTPSTTVSDKCLLPRGITIDDSGIPPPDPFSHFHTKKPVNYRDLDGLEKSTIWLDADPAFTENINREYKYMDRYHLCEAEYASFAKENLLKREPREEILDNTEDATQRFRRAERMLEFVCKPDKGTEWEPPPLCSSLDVQEYPTYNFDVRPDCSYWVSLHAINSRYAGQVESFLHVAQERIICPYLTVEFKRDDGSLEKAMEQAATFGALALYNRYRLRKLAVSDRWAHEQECQLRHYVLTITKSRYKLWCVRPNLQDGKWNGCNMKKIFVASLVSEQGVRSFVDWVNEVHRWGLDNHVESCEGDIKLIVEKYNYRVSTQSSNKEECTCND